MKSNMQKENRLYPRMDIATEVHFLSGEDAFSCYSKNISMNGMTVKTDNLLKKGTDVTMNFKVPSIAIALEIKGQVIWTKPDGLMGIKFKDITSPI